MKTKINLVALAIAVAAVAAPAVTNASLFAYVDQTGMVQSVTANTAEEAMVMAPNIDEHSGVVILDDYGEKAIVGEHVDSV